MTSDITIIRQDFKHARKQLVKILNYQHISEIKDWHQTGALFSPTVTLKIKDAITKVLNKARDQDVDLVVFPEGSIPKEFHNNILQWTETNNCIVVAGSFYDKESGVNISKCPVIYKGKMYMTQKIDPAPVEFGTSPTKTGLSRGHSITLFENTPIGNFAVLICSDNLMNTAKDSIKKEDLDFWIVPAFQKDSDWHYSRINNDVEGTRDSRYIIYSNNSVQGYADGGSAFFGVSSTHMYEEYIKDGYTNNTYDRKIVTLNQDNDYFIVKADIKYKRPAQGKFPSDFPNIELLEYGKIITAGKSTARSLNEQYTDENPTTLEKAYSQFHEFTTVNYLKKNIQFNTERSNDFFATYSLFFNKIISLRKGASLIETQRADTLFAQLGDIIENSLNPNPIVVNGCAGSGKSTLLSVLYLYLYENYITKKISKIPIYINLHYYNKCIYKGKGKIKEQAYSNFKKDVANILPYIEKNSDSEVILLIDGIDEYSRPKVDLEDLVLREFSSAKLRSKVIGIRNHKEEYSKSYTKNKAFPLVGDTIVDIELKKVTLDGNIEETLQLYADTQSLSSNYPSKQIKNYLLSKVKEYKIEELDVYTLNVLLKGYDAYAYSKAKTLSAFYSVYITSCGLDISKCSELAFKHFNEHESLTEKDKNSYEWWLIQKNKQLRDYLVAYNIAKRLTTYNRREPNLFSFVYPYELNNFCKEIINENIDWQRKAYEFIKELLPNVEITAKTHLCYLLGRFKDEGIREKSRHYLNQLRNTESNQNREEILEQSVLSGDTKRKLLYIRTIYISLAYLGDENASDKYIEQLLQSKYQDSLNRGFHLEYYEDIVFEPASPESLKHDDNLKDFPKTFSRLYKKIDEAIRCRTYYPLFQIELYTICSLAQHRQAEGTLDENKRLLIVTLIEKMLERKQVKINNMLLLYLQFLIEKLRKSGKFRIATFAKDLYSLKALKRTGWVEREVSQPETVASHMYGAYILGLLFLPNHNTAHTHYNKAKILEMLLIHDLGEAYIGDLTPRQKNQESVLEEERQMEFLSLIGTYSGLANIYDISDKFKEFTHNQTDINCVLARELDKLDCLLQLYIYRKNGNINIATFDKLRTDLIDKVDTPIGKNILSYIEELNEHEVDSTIV